MEEALKTSPKLIIVGEISGEEMIEMQNNICESYTSIMVADMNKINKVLDNLITKVKKHDK
ncbi:hypothetical protein ACR77J_13785 [Tissierella praeacuta]|uniref:hypothetical protein n=1 Tax=Tissierella praeacuta TaxID=43131 RepID=UPI003DA21CA8